MADQNVSWGAEGGELTSILEQVEKLVNENHVMETKEESIRKKRLENNEKIRRLFSKSSKLSRGTIAWQTLASNENIDDVENQNEVRGRNNAENQANVEESPGPRDVIVDELRQELSHMKTVLLKEIKTSGNNLKDHNEVLDTLEREHGRGSVPWRNMCKQVREFTRIHKKFKESRLKSIKDIEERLGESGDQRDSFHMDSREASSSTVNNATEVPTRRHVNESVLDCGKIVKKIPTRELAAITPTKLKAEEDSPEARLVCNFVYCTRTFTCASSLVSHLQNHYAQDQVRIDCPFPGCGFSNSKETLTTHMRARHTGEKLFSCQFCPTKFHTMVAKVTHEKKHSQKDLWAQCVKQHCRKFYRIAKGNCKSCGKK